VSEIKLAKKIDKEIKVINKKIDMKIIEGVSYKREARRHRLLLSMLHEIRLRQKSVSPLFRFASFIF
jgi:hypothetical protein